MFFMHSLGQREEALVFMILIAALLLSFQGV